ncbi:hypothetical protein LW139_07135 [Proteus vulgaris]|uniref:hypothetical protein n=1 Tax=Proteus vulgaris TaxID=585 RepID=UPI001FFEA8E8|nr:hypothetical protein [Proteus vulgaris]UPK82458.1 hypothetical protein LW139_07135 [Proteus vulgaris]
MEFEGSKTPWHIGSHPFEYRNRHTIRSDDNPMAGHNKPIQAVTIGKMTISQFGDGQL